MVTGLPIVLTGFPLVILLFISVVFIIIFTSKVGLHAFLVLLLAAYGTGLVAGLDPAEVATIVADGFGNTIGSIGIVILAGTVIGTILERSGAAIVIAETFIDFVGEEYTTEVMAITGGIVSIPVFCGPGFIILSGLNRALAERASLSLSTIGIALAGGLYVTHVFVPPTPGPIAAASIIGADIGLVMLIGVIVSFPIILVGSIWARRVASKYQINPNPEKTVSEIKEEYGTLPSLSSSLAPLLIPIALIALGSIASYPEAQNPAFITGPLQRWLLFLGDPSVALLLGVFIGFAIVPDFSQDIINDWVTDGLTDAVLILTITGAGGAFGEVLTNIPLENFIGNTFGGLGIGLLAVFIVAAALKTALGSSTVAIITAAGLVAPLLGALGLASQFGSVFAVLAIGAGSLSVSHANDSYFWIVTEFSDMEPAMGYQVWTSVTLILGILSIIWILILRAGVQMIV